MATEDLTLFENVYPLHHPSRVYFGLSECRERVKIGMTTRPNGRRGGEMHFYELCSVPGGAEREAEFHRKYADCRIGKSEWFYLTDQMALDLYAMCIRQERDKSAEIMKVILYARLRQRKLDKIAA